MTAPTPGHPTDDDLVLHYYGEGDPATTRAIDAHLARCQTCRSTLHGLDEVLTLAAAHAGEEAADGFERVMWARVRPAIEGAPRGWRARVTFTRLAFASGILSLVLAAFVAGRWWAPAAPAALEGTGEAARVAPERVWLVAVGDHLDRSQMVLAEVLNADPAAPVPAVERARAADLVAGSRLIRQSATPDGVATVTEVLEELERVLIEIANGGDDSPAADLEALRERIGSRGVLFRLRVVGAEVRERGLRRAPVS